ncbi:glycosyltransferase family 2 protein [Salinisphaera sp. Q1T1-3]|uniref:glycosyltransferase family 2 protein n=1 Tax=Salinisphaera sp. Q1T1-3 TaxID=2321229 RepID=UPI001F3E9922|nr:glycosyltransferase family 2 protein [Salinisphaera sp. Q1T1-3]
MPRYTDDARRPTISIIVAAYNIADYIVGCLDALLIPEADECEIIVVDDGSTDATARLLSGYADPRLRVLRQANAGLGAARNTGITAANGAYLLFVDGDDWTDPALVPACLDAIQAAPDVEMFVFDYFDVTETGQTRRRCSPDFWGAHNAAWNKLYRRDLIGDTRFDCGLWYEDLARVRAWLACCQHIEHIDAALYYYRNARQGSIMNALEDERLMHLPIAAERCIQRIEASDVPPDTLHARLGPDWQRRFYTVEVFVRGIIQRPRHMPDMPTRRRFIARMKPTLPPGVPDIAVVRRQFGAKIALASLLYKRGADRAAEVLLYDLRRARDRMTHLLGVRRR